MAYYQSDDPDGMMVKQSLTPDALMGWMESLADATRLRLLRLLERQELGVVELCEVLQLPQSTVSRHLKVLGDQKWVRVRPRGTTRLYRMLLDELDMPARRLWLLAREQIGDWATLRQDELRLTQVLAERPEEPADAFATRAEQWDKLRRELYGESYLLEAALALLPPGSTIADLGCGTGWLTARLAGYAERVIAVDNSPAMLKAARRRTEEMPNVELCRGDLAALPVEDGICDAALILLVLTYVDDPPAVLRETRRILKPGGRAVVVDLLAHDREDFQRQMEHKRMGFATEEMQEMMGAAGFAKIDLRPLPPEAWARGPALSVASGRKNVTEAGR
jgi:SAM-dependent methyltransferase